MKKWKLFTALLGAIFLTTATVPVQAQDYSSENDYVEAINAETRVYDFAGLMDEDSVEDLEQEIEKAFAETNVDIMVVTVEDNFGQETQSLLELMVNKGLYDGDEKTNSTISFLLDMDAREMHIDTTGIGIFYINDYLVDMIFDDVEDNIEKKDYKQLFNEFLEDVVYFVGEANHTQQYNEIIDAWNSGKYEDYKDLYKAFASEMQTLESITFNYERTGVVLDDLEVNVYEYDYEGYQKVTFFTLFTNPLINLGIGAVVALIVVLILMSTSKSKMTANSSTYRANLNMRRREDHFIRRTTTSRKIESDSGSSGNGGGGSSHSSGGRSHGGGGRSF